MLTRWKQPGPHINTGMLTHQQAGMHICTQPSQTHIECAHTKQPSWLHHYRKYTLASNPVHARCMRTCPNTHTHTSILIVTPKDFEYNSGRTLLCRPCIGGAPLKTCTNSSHQTILWQLRMLTGNIPFLLVLREWVCLTCRAYDKKTTSAWARHTEYMVYTQH